MNPIPTKTLSDGLVLPAIGFGTYKLKGEAGAKSIQSAIELGYRLIDSAFNYENEGTVGEAVRRAGVPRSELILTSKLPGRHHDYEKALQTVEESLFRTGVSYYDLYLIHWPNPLEDHYVEAWQAMIEAKKRGLVRSIGVCNFLPEHLQRLQTETGVLPSLNQVELHPYFNQAPQRAWHEAHGIATESWSPIGRGNDMLQNPVIADIARAHGKSITQVILRWHTQHNAIPLPKASSRVHQAENFDIFDFILSPAELSAIDGLSRPDGRTFDQDPAVYQEF